MAAEQKTPAAAKGLVQWQLPMKRVLHALVPICAAAVYFFGWRALALIAAANAAGFVTEYLFLRASGKQVSSAVFVTGTLFALSLPPTLPVWMAVVGAAFGVLFGKMVFGGFGRNVYNPALTGRAFIYAAFPVHMTAGWTGTVPGAAGGFAAWAPPIDVLTGATPQQIIAGGGGGGGGGEHIPWHSLFLGDVAGSTGETCALLALAGGLYIMWRRHANWRIVVSCFAGYLGLQTVFWAAGIEGVISPLYAVVAGSFVIGSFFYATDPVSAPKQKPSLYIYGLTIGLLNVIIKTFSAWNGAMMFSILLANTFAPITDHAVKALKGRKDAK